MALSISTFLMFEGDADDALALYRSVFSDFEMVSEQRYGADELLRHPWIVQHATLSMNPLKSTRSLRSFVMNHRQVDQAVPGQG